MEMAETIRNGFLNNDAGRKALADRKARSAQHNALYQGVALALAAVNRLHDQPTIVCDVLRSYGITRADLAAAEVEEYDLSEIENCLAQGKPSDRKQVSRT